MTEIRRAAVNADPIAALRRAWEVKRETRCVSTATTGNSSLGTGLVLIARMGAALIPAWRATRVDPIVALRCE